MLYYEAVVNNIKNIAMETDTLQGQWKSGRINRRYSLIDRLETKSNSQREFIETRYRKFFQARRKSCKESSYSFEASTMERSCDIQKSMPSVRLIREQKNKMGDLLRQTLTKYNFMNLQKEKKMQVLNQKKLKYEKIIKIRQESKRQKMELSECRAILERQQNEQKLKLKRSVVFQRNFKDLSMLRHMNEKKSITQERKKEEAANRFKIRLNKSKQIEHCQNRRLQILNEEKESKRKRFLTEQSKMRMSTQCYFKKLSVEIECAQDLDKQISKAQSFFNPKMQELQKQKVLIDSKLQKYSDFLKEGSTLKKTSFALMKVGQRISPSKLKTMKTESQCSKEQY